MGGWYYGHLSNKIISENIGNIGFDQNVIFYLNNLEVVQFIKTYISLLSRNVWISPPHTSVNTGYYRYRFKESLTSDITDWNMKPYLTIWRPKWESSKPLHHTNTHASVMWKVNLIGPNCCLDNNPRTTAGTFKSGHISHKCVQIWNGFYLMDKEEEGESESYRENRLFCPLGILNCISQPCGMILCLVCSSENRTD